MEPSDPPTFPLDVNGDWNYDYDFMDGVVYVLQKGNDIITVFSIPDNAKEYAIVSSAINSRKPLVEPYFTESRGYKCSMNYCNNEAIGALQFKLGRCNVCEECHKEMKFVKITEKGDYCFSEYLSPTKSLLHVSKKNKRGFVIAEKCTISLFEHWYPVATKKKDWLFKLIQLSIPEKSSECISRFIDEFAKPIFMKEFGIKYWLFKEYILCNNIPGELCSSIMCTLITHRS